jgi:hypothetical protein
MQRRRDGPGLTELTRMPRPMSPPEGVRAIEAMPALVAQLETDLPKVRFLTKRRWPNHDFA